MARQTTKPAHPSQSGFLNINARLRAALLRSSVMNHMIHHRAQLGVYLRLNETPRPPSPLRS